jgi:3-deoxy-7-phosphoheptulonate synthase
MPLFNPWTPFSWEKYTVTQGVTYPEKNKFEAVVQELKNASPLVTEQEINQLKELISKAAKGEAFILQGGDCSELFSECNQAQISNKFKILLQMSMVLIHSLKKPVVRIGRIAGQYAKPRSVLEETLNGQTLPVYRGDMINGYDFTQEARIPDPLRMSHAYQSSRLTLHYLRAQVLSFVDSLSEYNNEELKHANFFTSHEALHLPYEAALTREVEPQHFYNLSTHFPWIGMRTLHADSAHIEYLRGIENPIGIKVGPKIDFDELSDIISALNPRNELGKIVLIHRFGKDRIAQKLPLLLEKLTQTHALSTVICDPMHGNTYTTKKGIKTRYFNDILDELHSAFTLHQHSSIPLAGIHFEMTGEDVTECVGGTCGLKEEDLSKTYMSLVDPRLNYSQALEMALKVAEWHENRQSNE